MKKIISICMSMLLLFVACGTVDSAYLREILEEKTLMDGVTYRHIQGLYDSGFQDIFVVQADLKKPGVKFDVLKSQSGESFLEKTSVLAEKADALAALNADFFASKRGESGRGSAVGVEVIDGKLQSSASVEEKMNTLYKTVDDARLHLNAFTFDITLTANGMTDKVKLINKYDDLTGIVMYTDDWAEKSVGSVGGVIEVSVNKNGNVLEKVTESEPIVIPDGGFVLSAHMDYNTFLLDHVQVGDKISVDVRSTPNVDLIETAVGGGAILVHEGKVPEFFSHNISGRQPRSAIGLDENGTVITLVAVDGRREGAKGMTQTELANLMIDLGCFTALNFDGGGSTTMVVDENGEKNIVNTPSDGAERKVTNAVGVVSTLEENAPFSKITIESANNVFLSSSLALSVSGLDTYLREKQVDLSSVTFKATNGTVSNGRFTPKASGAAEITAIYRGFSAKKEIQVLEVPREIGFQEKTVKLKSGEVFAPVLIGKDKDGKKAEISIGDAKVSISGDAIVYDGARLVAKTKGAAIVTATFRDVTANMSVLVDGAEEIGIPENITIPDEKNVSATLKTDASYRFAVFGNTRKEEVLYDRFLMNSALYKMKENSKFQVFLGADIHEDIISRVTSDYVFSKNYNCFGDDTSSFITLPNVNGTVYSGDASVWLRFQEDVNRAGKNVFVFLDRNYISKQNIELISFYKIVEAAAVAGKNVFVFGGGFVNQNTVTNGVRYVNTAGIFPSIKIDGTSPSYIKYVLITVNGADVTYEYKPVFGE